MSDGPHKSLPMPRAWKKFTECVSNEAFSFEEVRDAIVAALEQDWRKQNMDGLVQRGRLVRFCPSARPICSTSRGLNVSSYFEEKQLRSHFNVYF